MAESTTGDRLHEAALAQGSVVGGKFVIKRFLAQGGMGRVYVADQQPMGRKVALKVMRRDLAGDERAVRRFFREAVAASKLQHPNTITLFDYGESEDSSLYIAMEYLDGLSLKDVLVQDPVLALPRAARIAAQVGLSLAEAHRKGVVHRDLKPENIFVSSVDGRPDFVKVIDFGIAHLLSVQQESRITQAGFVCGTPEYMSPEQARGDDIDGRADLYSLGVILYEMLDGEPPFQGETPLAIVLKHQTAPVPRLSGRHPEPLAELVARLMAKDPADRPGSAEAFLRELFAAVPDGAGLAGLELASAAASRQGTRPAAQALAAERERSQERPLDTAEMADTLASTPAEQKRTTPELTVEEPARPTARRAMPLWGGVLLVAALVVTAVLMWPGDTPDGAAGSSITPASPGEVVPGAGGNAGADAVATAGSGEGTGAGAVAEAGDGGDAVAENPRVTLRILTEPERAMVHLDGSYLGLSPRDVSLTPDAPHELVLMLDGYVEHREMLEVGSDDDGAALGPIVLQPVPAEIRITSDPDGAEVFEAESGESWGQTPVAREVPRSDQPIHLRIERSRYRTVEREVTPNQARIVLDVGLTRERSRGGGGGEATEGGGQSSGGADLGNGGAGIFGPPVD